MPAIQIIGICATASESSVPTFGRELWWRASVRWVRRLAGAVQGPEHGWRRGRRPARPLGGRSGPRVGVLSAYLSGHGSMINGNALWWRATPGWPPGFRITKASEADMRAGRHQRVAVGGQASLPWRL